MPALELLIRVVTILLLAWVIVAVLGKSAPSLRALVWTIALGSVLVLPPIASLVPRVEVALLAPGAAATPAPVPPSPDRATASLKPVSEAAAPGPSPVVAADPETAPVRLPPVEISWSMVAIAVWLAGLLLVLLRIVVSHRMLAAIARRGGDAGQDWQALVNEVREELQIARPVRARLSEAVDVPAIVGVFRPTLLLSPDTDELAAADRRDVVLHELAHVARWDALAQLVCQLSCAVYWFIPLAWHGAARAALLRERACDDVVLNAGSRASSYARNLLHLAGQARGAELESGALAMARPSRIQERIMGILDSRARRQRVTGRAGLTVIALAAGLIGVVAAVEPVERALAADPLAPGTLDGGALQTQVSAPPARRAARPDTGLLCSAAIKSSSNSIVEDNGQRRWRIKVEADNCKVDMRAEGKVEFNEDFTDVRSISGGGFFQLEIQDGGTRRELEIRSRNGALERTYRVNGAQREYDAQAREWFAAFLIELDRRTAVGVDIRLPLLLRQGGATAVLNETGRMSSDYARGRYYSGLLKATRLAPAELTRMLEQAAALMESDYYAAELLKEIGSDGLDDPGERAAVAAMLRKMDSDYYRAEVMSSVIDAGRPSPEEMTAMLEVVGVMESDYYQAETLGRLLENGQLAPEQRAMVARAASTMESSYYTAEVLKTLVKGGRLSEPERMAFLEAVGRIKDDYQTSEILGVLLEEGAPSSREIALILRATDGVESDYYMGEILGGLLQSGTLAEADLLAIVGQTRSIESEYNKSETLRRVLTNRGANERVRRAVLDAANSMNGYYRDEVKRAVGAI